MKKLLLSAALLLCACYSCGQDISSSPFYKGGFMCLSYNDNDGNSTDFKVPIENGKVVVSQVVEMEGQTADQIYNKAKLALTEYWRSSKDVSQYDDPANKIIISKGYSHWTRNTDAVFTQGFDVYYTQKIECKDGRYRVSMYGFRSYTSTSSRYGTIKLECVEAQALQAIKRNGMIRADLYGLSWIAWLQTANKSIKDISKLIEYSISLPSDNW